MTEALRTALRTHFGFDEFRPGQVEAIQSLLADRHTLVVMPTGAGKSLIYQFAALQHPGVTLVISPLIALMKDQVDSLARRGIPATYINSTLPGDEQAYRLQAMPEDAFRLVYVAPERLRNAAFQQALSRVRVSLLAVDEAHCISQWGHDFRPDYLYLDAARMQMGDDGPRIWLRPGAWDEAALQATAAEMEERRRHRRKQLAHMVAYAEANTCRRRILLDHFGDPSPADAPRCCDNHLARQAAPSLPATTDVSTLSDAERIGLAILDAVRRLKWGVGREKLAQILKDSRAKGILQFNYDQTTYYGRLTTFSLGEIKGLIEQLIEQGYLKVIGGDRPVLSLTPQGEAVLKARAPIPLRLPRTVRQEVVDRKREQGETSSQPRQSPAARMQRVVELGDAGSPEGVAELIDALEDPDGNVRRLAASALGKIGDKRAVEPLMALLARETKPQVRQYAVKALRGIGDPRARPLLEKIAGDETERDYTREAARVALKHLPAHHLAVPATSPETPPPHHPEHPYVPDDVADFLAHPHPRQLVGPWRAGWALDFHSRFTGANWGQSTTGQLTYRLKYVGDPSALQPLVEQALAVCAGHPELADVDALVPVPPSMPRDFDPVKALTDALAAQLEKPVWPVVVKTRPTAPQKEMRTLAQKKANVVGAFAVRGDVRGKRLLVVDDLYDSGATLEEVSRVLRQAGAVQLCVLTLTRTIHRDA